MVVQPLADLEIQILPYDRDALFDSLATAFGQPEPPIPDSVLRAQEGVRAAQEAWREAETRWQRGRDRLQEISNEMEGLNRGEARYAVLFREFSQVETEVRRLERQTEAAFEEFTDLQQAAIAATEQACIMQANWADEAFLEIGDAIQQRITATGETVVFDTTNAQGVAEMEVAPGEWWIHSRYELPYTELYWNVRVQVEKGDPVQVRLTPENAEERLNIC